MSSKYCQAKNVLARISPNPVEPWVFVFDALEERKREEKEMACHLYQIKENTLKNTTLFPISEAVCALGHHQASMVSSFSSRFMYAAFNKTSIK